MRNGADMRIKREPDLSSFLFKLSLNIFRKHVIVLERQNFAAIFYLI